MIIKSQKIKNIYKINDFQYLLRYICNDLYSFLLNPLGFSKSIIYL